MDKLNLTGKKWHEPSQSYAFWTGSEYLDRNGLTLLDPNEYDYSNGFYTA